MWAIEARGLTKTFRKRRSLSTLLFKPWARAVRVEALKGVDLMVPSGKIVGLLGANGAGKSTLIKILTSLISQTTGDARVNGYNVLSEGGRVRSSVGIVTSDERSLYWRLTGRENLNFFARLYGLPRRRRLQRIGQVVNLMDLGTKADHPVSSYSSGMRQQLAIARALLHDPPLLFLDEPTRSLDPAAAKRLRNFVVQKLNRETGKTVLIATHNLAECEEMCHLVVVLRGGCVVARGTVKEVAGSLLSTRTYVLTVRGTADRPSPAPGAERLEPGLFRISRTLPPEDGALGDWIADLQGRGFRIVDCRRPESPLQRLFDPGISGEES